MVCNNCGAQNADGVRFCATCGADLSQQYVQNNAYQQQPQFQQQNFYPNAPVGPTPGKGLAIASMVCGIVTLALFCIWYVSIITGILALVFGGVAKAKGCRSGMATAGIVCGSIGIGLMLIFIILVAAGIASMGF